MRPVRLALLLLLALPATARAEEATLVTRELPVAGTRSLAAAAAPEPFNLVGLQWQGPGRVSFRTRAVGGRWSRWRVAAPEAEDVPDQLSPERARRRGWRLGNPFWTGASDRVEYRLRGRVSRLRAHYVWSPVDGVPQRSVTATSTPSILSRGAWRASDAIRRAPPRYASAVRFALVHHTAGSNSYTRAQSAAIVRGIQLYHVRGNGWDDIGYNFLVDRYGQVFEGRFGGIDKNVIGAHAEGFNTGSVGVALIGNYSSTGMTTAARSALVRLLAWRLDVAHVDPFSPFTWPSGGNPRFPAGVPVFLRPISGHRDTGFTSCPGSVVYGQLNLLARAVGVTGLPKLYAPSATLVGGRVRFTGRLSSSIPWTVTIADSRGTPIVTGGGFGARVDWTWDARGAPSDRYSWTIAAGPTVRPASGVLIAGAAPSLTLSGVSAHPSTVSPNGDGKADSTTVRYTLGSPATVTATVLDADGTPVSTLFIEARPAGVQSFRWLADGLADGSYTLLLTAKTLDGREVAASVAVAVNRTLAFVTALPAFLSPNGDGRADTATVSFTLTAEADASVTVRAGGLPAATLLAARLGPGSHTAGWDGKVAGQTLPDGRYEVVVDATTALGIASVVSPLSLDTKPPRLRLYSAQRLLASLDEPARVTAIADGRRVVIERRKAGPFRIPVRRPFRSVRVVARDRAENDSRPLTLRGQSIRRIPARAGQAARRAARAG